MGVFSLLFGRKNAPYDPERAIARAILSYRPGAHQLDVLRIAYLAQIEHAGRLGSRIVPTPFIASSMGPMNQGILKKAKTLRMMAKRNPGLLSQEHSLPAEAEATVRSVCQKTAGMTSAQLVSLIHNREGCWAKFYHPDPYSTLSISDPRRATMKPRDVYDGHVIPFDAMVDQYHRSRIAANASSNHKG